MTVVPPWFAKQLEQLLTLRDRMPHALLLYGPFGGGKRAFGRAFARALLCESADSGVQMTNGCGSCAACGWFDQGNHPDFRRVTSEAIAAVEGRDEASDDEGGEDDDDGRAPRTKKAPSKEIRVEQIRALQRFLSVGTHRGRSRVVLLYPLEALNEVGSNALLKMLEEPPPATVFVIVADQVGRAPATIVSRCRKVPLPLPPREAAVAWLAERGVADADTALALAGGAPLAALALTGDTDALDAQRTLTRFLAAPDDDAAMSLAEHFARSAAAPLVHGLQRWLADCVEVRLAGRIRYHPAQAEAIARLARRADLEALLRLTERAAAVRRTIDHPVNVRLMLEGLLLAYAAAMAPAGTTALI